MIPILLLLLSALPAPVASPPEPERDPAAEESSFAARLVAGALERTRHDVTYDGSYRGLAYPGGDVPDEIGVCTDLIIRSYRTVGIDLQVRVHEDMLGAFDAYPPLWGLSRPDRNIDHRRVPNLRVFFRRAGAELPATRNPADYRPGDLVTWRLPSNSPHIGMVTDRLSEDGATPLIVHNIGEGPKVEEILFAYTITGHYRYPAKEHRYGPSTRVVE